jgi:hypothetical protein
LTVASPELGLGAEAVLSVDGSGTVVATFAKAAYLRLPAGLVALTTTGVPMGPIHARGRIPVDRLSPGDRVTVRGRRVQAGEVSLDLTDVTVWAGALPGRSPLAGAAVVALELLDAPRPPLPPVDVNDLAGAVAILAGRGPGLTPAGDDALAGILLLAQDPSAAALVAEAPTNDIARAFLLWAARGQSIEPVHRFLTTVVAGDRNGAAAALADLLRFGHSSGADLAYGLRLGFEALIAKSG